MIEVERVAEDLALAAPTCVLSEEDALAEGHLVVLEDVQLLVLLHVVLQEVFN